MRGRNRGALILTVALSLAVVVPAAAQARTLYGTTGGGKLLTFPDKATKLKGKGKVRASTKKVKKAVQATSRSIIGLPSGVGLVGIDFRPKTGELFGLGSNSVVYRVLLNEGDKARALPVGASIAPALSGASFGVDFNPVPDAIRIVSDAGQNLRITTPNTPTGNMDSGLNPGTPSIVGAGYSNSGFSDTQPGAGTTTLFTVDSSANTLNTQGGPGGTPSPNLGQQFTIGPLGVDIGTTVGFDVVGSFAAPAGYLTDAASGKTTLYKVNLSSGQATSVGQVVIPTKGKAKSTTLTGVAAVQD